uniref:Uncharacterized protein n=1 Tax=Salix viminalis TaxID=40686 RepID=A0A6N2N8P8_SALVM
MVIIPYTSVKEDNRLQEIKDRIRSLYVLCFIFRYRSLQDVKKYFDKMLLTVIYIILFMAFPFQPELVINLQELCPRKVQAPRRHSTPQAKEGSYQTTRQKYLEEAAIREEELRVNLIGKRLLKQKKRLRDSGCLQKLGSSDTILTWRRRGKHRLDPSHFKGLMSIVIFNVLPVHAWGAVGGMIVSVYNKNWKSYLITFFLEEFKQIHPGNNI